ncbi:MAG: DHA2 family efflux MFS transporter permease subunit [Odoribacter sp.]|nr:DHA2 family efflux MFS transporter permease subunit [Odoribacter sp.]
MLKIQEKIQASKEYHWWLLAIVMLGTFMAVLDSTVINVGINTIMKSFKVSISSAEWIITAYMMAMTIMLPTSGWLADKFGNKCIYLLGILFFTAGSWLCGRAENEIFLIVSRFIQGLGGGVIQALGLAIVTREFPLKQRGIALGLWSVAAAASISFGPLLGGYIIDHFRWNIIFDINVPIGLLALLLGILVQKEWKSDRKEKFDVVGFITAILFVITIIYSLSEAHAQNNTKGWKSSSVITSLVVSGISLAVFIYTELKNPQPLLNIRLLKDKYFGSAMTTLFVFGIGLFGGTYLLPLFMQQGLGYTALAAGTLFLPVGIIQGVCSVFSGFISRYSGTLILIVIGIIILAISFWMASSFSLDTTRSDIIKMLCVRGLGAGLTFAPLNVYSLQKISHKDIAAASGISNSFRQLSGSISIALLTVIMTTRMENYQEQYSNMSQAEVFISGITGDFKITALMLIFSLFPILFFGLRKK